MTDLAIDRVITALDRRGGKVRRRGHTAMAQCPAHEDRKPSLALRQIEGQVLAFCHSGCPVETVVDALGLNMADLYDEHRGVEYRYDSGRIVHRSPTKEFYQSGNLALVQLYRHDRLKTVTAESAVFLVEGEKDVHAIESVGGIATTAPMGADNFGKVDVSPLKGLWVTAVVDRDAGGQRWAAIVRDRLEGYAERLRFVEAKEGKDAADHVAAGHSLGDFTPVDIGELVPPGRRLEAVSAATMAMRAPRWLYDRRIPSGAITLLTGREGIGKSTISHDIAARITRGELPGRHQGTPHGVGIIATEDAWAEVILPRLVAAGADRSRVYRLDALDETGLRDMVSVPADLDRLGEVCEAQDIVLILLDPLMSVLHSSIDTHKDREVRKALDPLSRFAAETGIAVFGLIHVNKLATTDPLNSIMASRAFTAVARSVLYCIADPENEGEYLLGHPKSNLGPKQPTLRYRLVEVKIELEDADPFDDHVIVTSRVAWDGEDERSVASVMEAVRAPRAVGELATQLDEWIAEQGRTVSMAEIAEAFPDVSSGLLRRNLSRMVERGTLSRPVHGHYATRKPNVTAVVTPVVTPAQPSQPSQPSLDLDKETLVSDETAKAVSQHLSQRVSQSALASTADQWLADDLCGFCGEPLDDLALAAGRRAHSGCAA